MVKLTFAQHTALLYLCRYFDRYRGYKLQVMSELEDEASSRLREFCANIEGMWPDQAAEVSKLTVKILNEQLRLKILPFVDGMEAYAFAGLVSFGSVYG